MALQQEFEEKLKKSGLSLRSRRKIAERAAEAAQRTIGKLMEEGLSHDRAIEVARDVHQP